jgi:protein-S-isoprenylcysteine O-methyltransferase Ste14
MEKIFAAVSLIALISNSLAYLKINGNQNRTSGAIETAPDFKLFYSVLRLAFPISTALVFLELPANSLYFDPSPWLTYPSTVVLVFGQIVFHWAIRTLGQNYSPCYNSQLPCSITHSGPYKFSRHPIYFANIVSLGAISLGTGSWICIVMTTAFTYFCLRSITREEIALAENFPQYQTYLKTTPKLFGWH